MIRLPRMTRSDFGILCVVALVVLLASVLIAGISTRATTSRVLSEVEQQQDESAEQRQQHRGANQADHDCIVALALLLADPDRPRDREVVPPSICRVSPANTHNIESTEEPK